MLRELVSYDTFAALDIRVGTILQVEASKTNKPTWKMTIDLGAELGTRVSCGGYTNYTAAELTRLQVICVINPGTRKMGPEIFDVLVVGIAAASGGTIAFTPQQPAENGQVVF